MKTAIVIDGDEELSELCQKKLFIAGHRWMGLNFGIIYKCPNLYAIYAYANGNYLSVSDKHWFDDQDCRKVSALEFLCPGSIFEEL